MAVNRNQAFKLPSDSLYTNHGLKIVQRGRKENISFYNTVRAQEEYRANNKRKIVASTLMNGWRPANHKKLFFAHNSHQTSVSKTNMEGLLSFRKIQSEHAKPYYPNSYAGKMMNQVTASII